MTKIHFFVLTDAVLAAQGPQKGKESFFYHQRANYSAKIMRKLYKNHAKTMEKQKNNTKIMQISSKPRKNKKKIMQKSCKYQQKI